jgi:hypothetical protein
MTPEEQERIQACTQEIGEILYRNTPKGELKNLEGIERTVRQQMLEHVSPKVALFFVNCETGPAKGRNRTVRSMVGELHLRQSQAEQLGVKRHSRMSGLLEKACLRLSANESFQDAEADIAGFTGISVGHSTQQRLVGRQSFELPELKQGVSEVSIDGGKVRLRDLKEAESPWRDYKAVRLEGLYYAAFYQDNWGLIDYVNAQRLIAPLVCLGDGHDGVWNLFRQISTSEARCEILDWYHLKENLYKVGGSPKRLVEAESLLWQGKVKEAQALFANCRHKKARNFEAYLTKHRSRIVNYAYYQAEQLCSIGSGAVESAVKQIARRLQISGARWNISSVNPMLNLRCAYLNGQLTI